MEVTLPDAEKEANATLIPRLVTQKLKFCKYSKPDSLTGKPYFPTDNLGFVTYFFLMSKYSVRCSQVSVLKTDTGRLERNALVLS